MARKRIYKAWKMTWVNIGPGQPRDISAGRHPNGMVWIGEHLLTPEIARRFFMKMSGDYKD